MTERTYKNCVRCSQPHHHFAYCADGVKRIKNAPPFKKGDPLRGAAKKHADEKAARTTSNVEVTTTTTTAPAVVATTETATQTTAVSARDELRAMAGALPEGSSQRKAIEHLIARDEARESHAKAEAEIQKVDPSAHLPKPIILRDKSEDAARHLNSEMDRLMFAAGTSAASQRHMLPQEAQVVHDTLTGLEERREAQAAVSAPANHEHVPGSQPWLCHGCKTRFQSGTMDIIRRKAAAEPSWRFVCPECGNGKVEIIEMAATA